MADITVKQIADAIRRPGEDIAKAVDRVRNWTDEDLLKPVGKKNPGTGKPRLYPQSALRDALILSVLTEAVGMPAVTDGLIGKSFKMLAGMGSLRADSRPGPQFLFIGLSRARKAAPEIGRCDASNLAGFIDDSPHEAHVVIDVWKLNKRLESAGIVDG